MLEPGVMAARTLLSDGHGEAVARVCNYSSRPYTFKVDSFLGLAEPVVHVTGADGRAVRESLATSSGLGVLGQPDASAWPELKDLQSYPLPCFDLRAPHMAKDAVACPNGLYDHMQCLIDRLPDDLTVEPAPIAMIDAPSKLAPASWADLVAAEEEEELTSLAASPVDLHLELHDLDVVNAARIAHPDQIDLVVVGIVRAYQTHQLHLGLGCTAAAV